MKTDHQDFRIPNELVLGKKLKMNGKTSAGLDKILPHRMKKGGVGGNRM